ncbi:MAG: sugar ABC transporter ATP-binding protein [Anaeromicrobium sp.]|jgi:simple sugar transport system ATP-binding protein|uniref:sugar ABC transporter ATP-binding protein n=1 Tax=Anaeromicrobium sp. TaxID=1929132 RepID=UPI0025D5ED7B|nr:sugar ABC transporter ATP-binding protein [Anaeromicrobium sp.]MCT4595302.1 sugar ABC transporter ATP-binding protein [Anaeromicrobium sp.]
MKAFKVEMQDISIEFPGVKALKGANFITKGGVVHALIGANGAGKSTLMKILSGAYSHWTGNIIIDGNHVNIRSAKEAKDLGIQIVYQEVDVALIPYLTVAENILVDEMVNGMDGRQFINWKSINKKAQEVLGYLNVDIPIKKKAAELTLAEKQMVLIARAIAQKCSLLILDEPTAPLSKSETDELFRVVEELKEKGVGIIFISHRLPEIFTICDNITIMRDGKFITKMRIKDTDEKEVVEHMLGRSLDESYPKYEVEIGEIALQVKNLKDNKMLKGINLDVRKGEIVGIAGLVGAGKTELCKALFGAEPITSGEIILNGKNLSLKDPNHAVEEGIALVPEERRKEGILVEESVMTNLTLGSLESFSKNSFIQFKKEYDRSWEIIKDLGIKTPNESQKVTYLSGGNQQKVAVGKWLIADADVYIFDEPTKGVDVGAKTDIFHLIGNLVSKGKSVIYATCETQEILGISDKIYVMYDGQIVKELITKDTLEDEILFHSAGGNL